MITGLELTYADVLPIADPADRERYAGWILIRGCSRDSDALERSNWAIATGRIDAVDPELEDHAELRFGHWACGWIEELAVRPGTLAAVEGLEILEELAGYPVLDESHYSQLEWDDNHPDTGECYGDRDCPCDARRLQLRRAHLTQLVTGGAR